MRIAAARLALAALCLASGLSSPLRAELTIEASLGFDGFYTPGEWTPLRVTLSNMPAANDTREPVDLEGTLTALSLSYDDRPFTYAVDVDLPANSRKTVWLVVKAAAQRLTAPPEVRVEFRASNRRQRVEAVAQGRVAPRNSAIILIVRGEGQLETVRLPGITGSQSYTAAAVTEIPTHWAALSSVAAIFLTRTTPLNLGQPEIDALTEWVDRGGVLVVDGGAGRALAESSLAPLLPVAPSDTATYVPAGQGRFLPVTGRGAPLPEDATVLLRAAPRTGAQILWRNGPTGEVLAATRRQGLGHVAFVAWDLTSAAMAESQRALSSLASLVPPPATLLNRERFHQMILQNIAPDPSVSTPSLLLVLLLLAAYWLAVGPVNYLVLSRRRRIEWSWLTIPAIIAAFCALFYAIGALTRSGRDSLRHINVVSTAPGVSVARADALSLHFSASKQRLDFRPNIPSSALSQVSHWESPAFGASYQMNFGPPGQQIFPRPGFGVGNALLRDSGDPASVRFTGDVMALESQSLRQWSFAYLESQGAVDLGGAIHVSCEFIPGASAARFQLEGRVTNATPFTLRHTAILWGGTAALISAPGGEEGVLRPGETVDFSLPWGVDSLSAGVMHRTAYETRVDQGDQTHIRAATLRASFLDGVELEWLNTRRGRPALVAFGDRPLLAPEPNREVERVPDTTLFMVDLPLTVSKDVGFTLGGDLLPATYSVMAANDDAVRITSDWQQRPQLQVRDAQVLVTYRLPLAPGVGADIGSVSANLRFADSDTQWIRLFALDRTASEGDPWIAIPTHSEGGPGVGIPLTGEQRLDARRVVDAATGEITLMIDASPKPEARNFAYPQYANVDSLSLTVGGVLHPPAPESTIREENAS